jgi:hypothetical protein
MNQIERAQEAIRKTGLTYQSMADEYGVNLGQIKHFMSGRLKKVPPEIAEVLVNKFNISPYWLMEGSGPMLKIDVAMGKIKDATNAVTDVVMHYAPFSKTLMADMQEAAYHEKLEKEQLIERFRDRLPKSEVVDREMALLDNYRVATEIDKRTIERTAALAASDAKSKKKQ